MKSRKSAPKLPERPLWMVVHDWASEIFALQVLGESRAMDIKVTGQPLVYTTYRNGVAVNGPGIMGDGALAPWRDFAGTGDRVRAMFLYETRTKGHDVIVWRTLPEQDEDPKTGMHMLYFRCAFTSQERLRTSVVGAARIMAGIPELPTEPGALVQRLQDAIKACAPNLGNLVAAQMGDISQLRQPADAAAFAIEQLSHTIAAAVLDAAVHTEKAA